MGAFVSKDTKFENLLPFLKKKVLRRPIEFQGFSTTLSELVGLDDEILSLLTGDDIKMLLDKNEVMKIGTVHDLKLKYSLVPRKFFIEDNDLGLNRFDKCEDQKMTFNEINGSKLIILSDHANSGKSVTFKYFATRMKEHKKLCWVSYIDLKSYRRLFDLFVDKEMRVEDCYDILFNSIGIKSQFEASILRKFLINGQAILFLDGIDEYIPMYSDVLMNLFEILYECSKSGNQIWISTRPQMSMTFQQFLQEKNIKDFPEVYNFAPFTYEEKEKMIESIIEFNGIHDQDQKMNILKEVLDYLKSLVTDKEVENLFMIQSIVEYRVRNYKRLNLANHYDIFSKMILNEKTFATFNSNEQQRNNTKFNIWNVHRVLALLTSFPANDIASLTIVKKWNEDKANWSSDHIQRYGFVCGNLDGSAIFVHKSFADFFVAQFIIHFLYDQNSNRMKIEEVNDITKLFIKIMCGKKPYKNCCNFLLSNFISYGSKRHVVEKVKQVIYENLPQIRNPINISKFSSILLKNFAIFMTQEQAMMRKFLRLDDDFNFLDEYVLKGWMETNSSYFINAMTSSLGPNWHHVFNKSPRQLVTHQEIEKYEYRYNDYEFIKICDYFYNSNNSEAKNRFLNNFYRVPCYNRYIQLDIIERMVRTNRAKFIEECFIKICYEHMTTHVMIFLLQTISQNFEANYIRKVLFENFPDDIPPLLQTLPLQDPEIFRQTKVFYTRYASSWEEVQNLFLFQDSIYLFYSCITPAYEEFKEYLETIFGINKWLLRQKIVGIILNGKKIDKSLKCPNAKDLIFWIYFNNKKGVEDSLNRMFDKIFEK